MENKHGMANQSYYRLISDGGISPMNDRRDDSVELQVNCCGEVVMRHEWAHNKRSVRRDFYLLYSLGGVIVGDVDGKPVRIGHGQVACISPGTEYCFGSLSPQEEWTRYFWIHFTGNDAEHMLADSGIETNTVYATDPDTELNFYYERLFEEFRTRDDTVDYAAALLLRMILLYLGRSVRGASHGRRLDKSIRYIHTHIRYDLSVEKLASMEYLGVSRYRELFRTLTGTSPIEYIIRLRMTRAMDLLSQTGNSIAQVAESVGYDNRHYFQSTFKKYTGMTPGEYRTQRMKG